MKSYYLPAFLEGFTVMAIELIVGHILYIYYGATLITWSSVIGFTIGGLALGYFISGKYSFPGNSISLAFLFSFLSLMLFFFPWVSEKILFSIPTRNLQSAILFSSFILLMPFTVILGTIPPALIRMSVENVNNSGYKSGKIFAISTLGGILSCFLCGFYLMPSLGIKKMIMVCGILTALYGSFILYRNKKKQVLIFTSLGLLLLSFNFYKKPNNNTTKVVHNSEGILGQLMVVDDFSNENENIPSVRVLFMNRTPQTVFFPHNKGNQYSEYVLGISALASIYPSGCHALLLGAGGGAVIDHFHKLGFKIDVCELDNRMLDAGRKFFILSKIPFTMFIDDARHYLNVCPKRYDVIVFDIFNGESSPPHVLTMESIEKAKNILNPGGMVLINFNGFLKSPAGISTRSVIHTLLESGMHVNVLPTPGEESSRNCIISATFHNLDISKVRLDSITDNKNFDLKKLLIPFKNENIPRDAQLLTDDKPILEIINLEANFQWRSYGITHSLKKLYKKGVSLFY